MSFSSQLLTASATEAAKVAEDIRDSLNDQKELLALAARQQEQVLCKVIYAGVLLVQLLLLRNLISASS